MMGHRRCGGFLSLALFSLSRHVMAGFHVPWSLNQVSTGEIAPSGRRSVHLMPGRPQPLFALGKDEESPGETSSFDEGSEDDWRAFRAKLVMSEKGSTAASSSSEASEAVVDEEDLDGIGAIFSGGEAASQASFTPLDPSQWAYDSGKVIEQGAVILGGVEQDFGFGLRQQYFHKAVILVLEHDENQFTKGIILNRPSDRMLHDDINPGAEWRVFFGGDVQGLDSILPDIVCLHSLKSEAASKASVKVMKDIQWTSFENAKKLVKMGEASPSDFWLFAGYAGWGPKQLMGELDRKSWYMVATDSQTLLKELARQSAIADPRDAGLDTWELLMNMIGRGETSKECSGGFDDLCLKEWSREHLLSVEAGGGAGRDLPVKDAKATEELSEEDTIDRQMKLEGTVVRGSSIGRSPFLISKQEYHKSVVLVILDSEQLSVGVMLNRPAARGIELDIVDKLTMEKKTHAIPLRFGGEYAVKGQNPLLWLHCSARLRDSQIGSMFGTFADGIWKCTQEEATRAIGQGLAQPDDFIVVSGVSVWTKEGGGLTGGLQGEVLKGNFEIVSPTQVQNVWKLLVQQEVLTKLNIVKNVALANEAWKSGSGDQMSGPVSTDTVVTDGIGDSYDEDDDTLVYKSDTKVSELSDDALRSWIATFLLGAPTLGG